MRYDDYQGCPVDPYAEPSALDRRILDEQRTAAMDRAELDRKGGKESKMESSELSITREAPEQYHESTRYWSRSMIWEFMQRRSVCYQRYVLGTAPAKQATKAMDLGTLAHAALLEPHRLESLYAIYPEDLLDKRGAVSTEEAKDWRTEQQQAGRICVKSHEFDPVLKMAESVKRKVGHWLTDAKIEQSIYWKDSTGLPCRCRPDALIVRDDLAMIVDLKSTADITPHWFRKRVEDGGYWLQDAHYSEGVERLCGIRPQFLFVGVESEWPYDCAVYDIRESDRHAARIKLKQELHNIHTCFETADWSDAWTNQVTTLNLKWSYSTR